MIRVGPGEIIPPQGNDRARPVRRGRRLAHVAADGARRNASADDRARVWLRHPLRHLGARMGGSRARHRAGVVRRSRHLLPHPPRALLRRWRVRRVTVLPADVPAHGQPRARDQPRLPVLHRADGVGLAPRRRALDRLSAGRVPGGMDATHVPMGPLGLRSQRSELRGPPVPSADHPARRGSRRGASVQRGRSPRWWRCRASPASPTWRLRCSHRSGSSLSGVSCGATRAPPAFVSSPRSGWHCWPSCRSVRDTPPSGSENPHLGEQTYWRWWQPAIDLPGDLITGRQLPTAVPVTLVVVVIGAALARRRPAVPRAAWAHGALWALCGTLIALPRAAFWNGHPIVVPQTILAYLLPAAGFLRESGRLGVAGLMGLAVLVGAAFAESERRLARSHRLLALVLPPLLAVVVAGEMYREYAYGWGGREPLPSSYPLARAPTGDSPLLDVLRQPGGPLLELPVALTPFGPLPGPNAAAMYRSIFHWRSLVNGYSGYWPAGFIDRMVLAERLPDAGALTELRQATGVALILVHTPDLPERGRAPWLELAGRGDDSLRLVARDGDDLLFAVE